MNPSSLINGPFSSNKKQHLKEAAYIDFLKSFSQNGLVTLEKLQSQFNKHYDHSSIKEDFKVFQKIRTLVSSYEVFVIEIHDSCEFIEVPQFGTCILKVFIQLVGILKWTLQFLTYQQKNVQPQSSQPLNIPRNGYQQYTSSYNSRSTPKARRDSHIRNTYAPNTESSSKEMRCSQCGGIKTQQNDENILNICRLKEKTSLQLQDINEEINRISREFAEEEKASLKQDIEKDEIHRFMRKREEAQRTYLKMGLGEQSKNEEILSEILIALNRKGEAIKRFADLRMNSLGELNKTQQPPEEDYETFRHELEVDITQKVFEAKQKLYAIFKEHLAQHQKKRKCQLVDVQVQIDQDETAKLKKLYNEKQNKKFKTQINRLQKQLQNQKALNQSLQQILKNKSHQYEAQIMKYRNQLITLEAKSKKDLKTLSKLKNQQNTVRNLKKMTSILDKSSAGEGRSLGSINFSPSKTEEQQQEEDEEQPKLMKIKGFLKSKKRHQKSRNFTMFHPISDKYESLDFLSPAFQLSFMPDLKPPVKIIQIVKIQKVLPEKVPQIDVYSQTTNDLLQKYLYGLLQKQAYNKTKALAKTFTSPKPSKNNSQSKSHSNIMTYSKKGSSYMGNLANYYEIQKNSIQNTNRDTLCSRLYPKSSMVVQRPFDSSIKDKQIKNDFIPIFGKGQDVDFTKYKKNYFRDTNTLKTLRNSNFITHSKLNKNSFGEIKPSNETSPSQSFRFPVEISDDSDLQNTVQKQVYHSKRLKKSKNIHDSQQQIKSIKNQNYLGFDTQNSLKYGSGKSLKVNSSLNTLPDFSKIKRQSKRPSNVQKIKQDFVYENKV